MSYKKCLFTGYSYVVLECKVLTCAVLITVILITKCTGLKLWYVYGGKTIFIYFALFYIFFPTRNKRNKNRSYYVFWKKDQKGQNK